MAESVPMPELRSSRGPASLVAAGLLLSAQALLDPAHPAGRWLGPLLCGGALLWAWRRSGGLGRLVVPALLATAFALGAYTKPEFAADSHNYYVYLRSAYFDHDLDFADEWAAWGFKERRLTATGHRPNLHSIGPAVLWSPFYVLADAYVAVESALPHGRYVRDGYSLPYRRAPALGTITIALLGTLALIQFLARRQPWGVALLAVGGAVLCSPTLYYVFVMPAMAHGLAFGLAAGVLWAADRAAERPSAGSWSLVGVLLGLLALTRWQALVFALYVAALALRELRRSRVRLPWLALAALLAALAFVPQLVAWRVLYGSFFTVPQGGGFLDWASPHFLDSLVSGDHGFFSWTPLMAIGSLGLLLALRTEPLLGGCGLLILLASAWVNGSVSTWAGGDAFGARRFDICVPFAAAGLALVIERSAALVRRAPLWAPAAALLLLALWNLSFIASFREQRYPYAAPADRLAGEQGRNLRRFSQELLGRLAGARGRALAYKYFSGEYFYENYNWGGTIPLVSVPESDLSGGWSPPRRKPGTPGFRWALQPSSCVRIPLQEPVDLRVVITVRTPEEAQPQQMTVRWNEQAVGTLPVGTAWSDLRLLLPARAGVPGENYLCLQFAKALPGDDEAARLAAQVAVIQLP